MAASDADHDFENHLIRIFHGQVYRYVRYRAVPRATEPTVRVPRFVYTPVFSIFTAVLEVLHFPLLFAICTLLELCKQ